MEDQPATRPSLLARIRDPRDAEAWAQFVALYSPLVYRFARRRGLQASDAADVTQDVFRAVARSIRHFDYDRRRGSFRGWLMTVARSKLNDFTSKRQGAIEGVGGTTALKFLEQQASREEEEDFVDREYRRCLFDWAAGQVRREFEDSTWESGDTNRIWNTEQYHSLSKPPISGRVPRLSAKLPNICACPLFCVRRQRWMCPILTTHPPFP